MCCKNLHSQAFRNIKAEKLVPRKDNIYEILTKIIYEDNCVDYCKPTEVNVEESKEVGHLGSLTKIKIKLCPSFNTDIMRTSISNHVLAESNVYSVANILSSLLRHSPNFAPGILYKDNICGVISNTRFFSMIKDFTKYLLRSGKYDNHQINSMLGKNMHNFLSLARPNLDAVKIADTVLDKLKNTNMGLRTAKWLYSCLNLIEQYNQLRDSIAVHCVDNISSIENIDVQKNTKYVIMLNTCDRDCDTEYEYTYSRHKDTYKYECFSKYDLTGKRDRAKNILPSKVSRDGKQLKLKSIIFSNFTNASHMSSMIYDEDKKAYIINDGVVSLIVYDDQTKNILYKKSNSRSMFHEVNPQSNTTLSTRYEDERYDETFCIEDILAQIFTYKLYPSTWRACLYEVVD